MPSMIQHGETNGEISFFHSSSSFVFPPEEVKSNSVDEYADDDDPGFDIYVVNEENFVASCKELAELNNFPQRAIKPDTKEEAQKREKYLK